MKILLIAINAKFIHSSLAIASLKQYAGFEEVELAEYTINQSADMILQDIYEKHPGAVGFSCYLWNIGLVLSLAENLKKVLPGCILFLGGPEVSYDAAALLRENPSVEIVMRHEGEAIFAELAAFLLRKKGTLSAIRGITYRDGDQILCTPDRPPLPLEKIPFPYTDISPYENRILYYETQRGCPFQCQYCLSSLENGVRFLPQWRIEEDLTFFLERKVRQVKLVDRTFNANKRHAMAIWGFLIAHDNGVTNFHMEIAADLLDKEMLALLRGARPGLFQFEIGVQSTNTHTLAAIKRQTSFVKISQAVSALKESGNIHLHLDLIAGLPYEDYLSFASSFNDVYRLAPEQLQLGFLKLLKGSGLRKDANLYQIDYHTLPPYEVLQTKELRFHELLRLKAVEEMLSLFYNSGKALFTLPYLIENFSSPFAFYEALGSFWKQNGYHKVQHSKLDLFVILYQFAQAENNGIINLELVKDLLRLDIYRSDKPGVLPEPLRGRNIDKEIREFLHDSRRRDEILPHLRGLSAGQAAKRCHIEAFSYAVLGEREKRPVVLAFYNYKKEEGPQKVQIKDITGGIYHA